MSQPRLIGNSLVASRPCLTSSQRSSGEVTPPGNLQDMPTIAISSSEVPCGAACREGARIARDLRAEQETRDRCACRVVKDDRRADLDTAHLGQAVSELNRAERVKAKVLERLACIDRCARCMTEHCRDLTLDEFKHEGFVFCFGQLREARGQRAGGELLREAGTRTRPRRSGGSMPARA